MEQNRKTQKIERRKNRKTHKIERRSNSNASFVNAGTRWVNSCTHQGGGADRPSNLMVARCNTWLYGPKMAQSVSDGPEGSADRKEVPTDHLIRWPRGMVPSHAISSEKAKKPYGPGIAQYSDHRAFWFSYFSINPMVQVARRIRR